MELIEPKDRPVRIGAGTLVGVDAIPVIIEALMHGDGKGARLLGSVDRVVRESFHRVLSAFKAAGLPTPRGMPVVNFAPAGVPKSGTGFDLPLALALAGAGGQIDPVRLRELAAHGEVGLDGSVLPVRGVVPVALAARERGWPTLLAAPRDASRAACVPRIDVVSITSLADAIAFCNGRLERSANEPLRLSVPETPALDLADIRGNETAKRALCIAAAGRHNLLLIGPPGSGKSALAHRLGGLLPPPDESEQLDILRIRSAHGTELDEDSRPLRSPHHSSSAASILGGGVQPRPGEVTLAHHGVLFLDELAEFRRETLEGLRQPLEEQRITIGRAQRTATMPADFVLVAAMNPCPCGFAGAPHELCRCSPRDRSAYLNRISGPLLDRFDQVVSVPPIQPEEWNAPVDPIWATAHLRQRVIAAVERQRNRSERPNGRLQGGELDDATRLQPDARSTLDRITRLASLSGRGRVRITRLARTLADLSGAPDVRANDIYEAARLRGRIAQRS